MPREVKTSWKTDFHLPVGVSLSARRQVEVMTAKLGSTPERNLSFPCERHLVTFDHVLFQGESIETPAEVAFRALQQVIARQDLLETESDRQVTLRFHYHRLWAGCVREAVATYLVVPRAGASCRLLLKVLSRYQRGWQGRVLRAPAQLVLARALRRSLLEIKQAAEQIASQNMQESSLGDRSIGGE